MYICPTCKRGFESEVSIRKHFFFFFKEQHPYHQYTSASHAEDIVTLEADDNVLSFFDNMRKSK